MTTGYAINGFPLMPPTAKIRGFLAELSALTGVGLMIPEKIVQNYIILIKRS